MRSIVLSLALICGAIGLLPAPALAVRTGPETVGPIPPLSASGRWLTDAAGRVVMLHGFNEVSKSSPFYPAAFGFGDDDAAFLEGLGFNAVRLGVVMEGLIPAPGEIDDGYVEHIAETVDTLARHHLFVLLDFHQDGFAPLFHGNGLPDWMAITDGLPNPPDATFPLYYVLNPAMQRAFEHLWANDPGPDGIGLQDHYVEAFAQDRRPLRERAAGHRLRGDQRAVAGSDVDALHDRVRRPRAVAARAVLPQGDGGGARGRSRAARVRRAVRALQLRQRADEHAGHARRATHSPSTPTPPTWRPSSRSLRWRSRPRSAIGRPCWRRSSAPPSTR